MKKIKSFAVLFVIGLAVFVLAAPGLGQAQTIKKKEMQVRPSQKKIFKKPFPFRILTCSVDGTPVEFPNDVRLCNKGQVTITKGTKIHWEIPDTPFKGDYTFSEDLVKDKCTLAPGVPAGYPAGAHCNVTFK